MVLLGYFKSANVMQEKRTCAGWKMVWVPDGNHLKGYVMCANGAITKDGAGRVDLETRAYDTNELENVEKRTLLLKKEWEW